MNLLDVGTDGLKNLISELGEPAFRAKQVREWLFRGADFSEMTNISKSLREKLEKEHTTGMPKLAKRQISSDGTEKYLMRMADGAAVEGVVMNYEHGRTMCISTQVGCAMGCVFCCSGENGLTRHLTSGEMLGEIIFANRLLGEERAISNIVLMGTGEPLHNYDNTVKFLREANAKDGLGIGWRSISLSTCGIVPRIYDLAKEGMPITLCLSLHSARQSEREKIMPIAKKYSIAETVEACLAFEEATSRRITIEYTVIQGVNDTDADLRELKALFGGMNVLINLIPLNEGGSGSFKAPSRGSVYKFADRLLEVGLNATVRRSLGRDIDGACGQLRAKEEGWR